MTTCKVLREQCKEYKIKGYSKMNKAQLASVIYLKQVSDWYEEIHKPLFNLDGNTNQQIISLVNNETIESD
jgi:hypothetical protein